MSYIARLAERSAAAPAQGASSARAVTPALRTDSPLAAFDQRFNLPGFSAIPLGAPLGAFDGPEDIDIEEDLPQVENDFGTMSPSAGSPFGAFPFAASEKARETSRNGESASHGEAPSRGVEGRISERAPLAPGVRFEAERARPSATPSFSETRADELKKVVSPLVAGFGATPLPSEARGETPAGKPRSFAIATSAPAGSAPAPGRTSAVAGEAAAAPSRNLGVPAAQALPGALQSALARVEAWMREDSPPRQADGPRSAFAQGSVPHGAGFAAPMTAPPAPSRLSIGHIEVEVVAPRAAPPVRTPRVVQAAAPAQRWPSGENLGRLAFGMRQR